MKYKSFLIKYAEIGVKGKNRYLFEDALVKQIHHRLKGLEGGFSVTKEAGRIYAEASEDFDYDEVVEALGHVFGIVGICPMVQIEDNGYEDLKARVVKYIGEAYEDKNFTFKVVARRANKQYPVVSDQINRDLGEVILNAYPETRVDVHNPDVLLRVEVRHKINIFSETIPGPGGMPIGTAGKAMLLLSGGIDSPVAGYMMAKRGLELIAVHFASPPYTSERARQKVLSLGEKLLPYTGRIRLFVVPFTEIQERLRERCPEEYFTLLMRRAMMRIAEAIALEENCQGLITGESVGQVASQTIQAIGVTDCVTTLPVLRPAIGLDKSEIVAIARKIDTFEISILPYEDCCTVFTPRHPRTRPKAAEVARIEEEAALPPELFDEAIRNAELVVLSLHRSAPSV